MVVGASQPKGAWSGHPQRVTGKCHRQHHTLPNQREGSKGSHQQNIKVCRQLLIAHRYYFSFKVLFGSKVTFQEVNLNIYLCKMQLLVFNLSKKAFYSAFVTVSFVQYTLAYEIYLKQSYTSCNTCKNSQICGFERPC